ncbi:MAG: hypothetical protein LBW77_04415 [Verrucomicrobiota bacterium]|jgi:hypothetical protein|nr:hypothetical protein [Verrucomicrobiota bacterium]
MNQRKGTVWRGRAAGAVSLLLASVSVRAGDDPFAGVEAAPVQAPAAGAEGASDGWTDNLLFRKELYVLFGAGWDNFDDDRDIMSRVSAGFEVQKRFATATRTVASFDYQGRVVYRDRALDTAADPMGRGASPWKYETHNAYADVYNLSGEPGRLNLRAGYAYQPFGLNGQTDTHATLLQLSNDRLFGAERDWQAALYGALTEDLDYTVGYLLGAGPDHELDGQSGMGAARVALNSDWLFRRGLEGGVSFAGGQRVDRHAWMRSHSVMRSAGRDAVIDTWRAGADARKRLDSAAGPFTLAAELAVGEDEDDLLASGLTQADWLHPSRRFGTSLQYSHFWQDVDGMKDYTDARATGVLTYYFKNDVGNANLHWLALAVERIVRRMDEPEDTLLMIQYYRYW